MFIYTILTIPIAILAGLLIALLTKKADHVAYGALDKAARVINIVLIPVYLIFLPFTTMLGIVAEPAQSGMPGVIGWIVAVLVASAALFSGLGLGASVALRKRGKSAAGFAVQFSGFAGLLLSVSLYVATAGTLLATLN